MLGFIRTSNYANKGISFKWRGNFYYSLLGLLASEGLNEAEDEIENFPHGRVPIMTIHQSKGLEFPLVFVYGLSPSAKNDESAVKIEDCFARFRRNSYSYQTRFKPEERKTQDLIRLFYVAYSRAQYALVLLLTKSDYARPGIGCGPGSSWSVFGHATEIRRA
jgi:DNA helicase-2/ATP-dependent DNA helicase PcrA